MNDDLKTLFQYQIQQIARDLVYTNNIPTFYGNNEIYSLEMNIKNQVIQDLKTNFFNSSNWSVSNGITAALSDSSIISPLQSHIEMFIEQYLEQVIPEIMKLLIQDIDKFNKLPISEQSEIINNNPHFFRLLYQPDTDIKNTYLFKNVL